MSKLKRTFNTGETSVTVDLSDIKIPATLTLSSADATRKIELSANDRAEFFDAQIDKTTATMLQLAITTPVTDARFTGVAGNTIYVSY